MTALQSFTDWLGNKVEVGDHVVVVRAPAHITQMYTGQVLGIKEFDMYRSKGIKAQIVPTGLYSTGWEHDWPTEIDLVTNKKVKTGERPRASWIEVKSVMRIPPEISQKLLDILSEHE